MRIQLRVPRLETLVVAALFTAGAPAAAGAQSLAAVARQEEARRKAVRPAEKIYTNEDLARVPPPATGTSPADSPAGATPAPSPGPSGGRPGTDAGPGAASGSDVAPQTPPAAATGAAAAPRKDEAYWRSRLQGLHDSLERDRSYAVAMQSRINALTTDFTNRDDPAQRALIGVERQKALSDLARLESAIEGGKKAIADLEEEARRAGAPAGWLR